MASQLCRVRACASTGRRKKKTFTLEAMFSNEDTHQTHSCQSVICEQAASCCAHRGPFLRTRVMIQTLVMSNTCLYAQRTDVNAFDGCSYTKKVDAPVTRKPAQSIGRVPCANSLRAPLPTPPSERDPPPPPLLSIDSPSSSATSTSQTSFP